jgi:hypothetical protein
MKKILNPLLASWLICTGMAHAQTSAPASSPGSSTAAVTPALPTATAALAVTSTAARTLPMKNVHWVRVQPPLPADLQSAGVYFELVNSPLFSQRFSQALAASGYKVVDRATAKYVISIEASYGSQGKVQARADLGKVLELGLTTAQATTPNSADTAHALTQLGFTAVLMDRMVSAGLITRLVAGGNFLNALADVTGVRSWVNEKFTGDRRGVCLAPCETWEYSNQRVTLRFKEPTDWKHDGLPYNIGVGIHSPYNDAQALTNLALVELHRYFGLAQVEQPGNFPAVMTRQEIMDSQKNQSKAREP